MYASRVILMCTYIHKCIHSMILYTVSIVIVHTNITNICVLYTLYIILNSTLID